VRYDQTIGDLKAAVSAQMSIPVEQQQLFWHKKELTAAYDERTLLDMNMHTGFAIKGYDLVSTTPPARPLRGCVSRFFDLGAHLSPTAWKPA
jgi:hypothetical protein